VLPGTSEAAARGSEARPLDDSRRSRSITKYLYLSESRLDSVGYEESMMKSSVIRST
jgi:hypothetical protein